jgi:CBS domain-containing protein
VDEVANAALWLGVVMGAAQEFEDITQRLSFDVAKSNFVAAARMGLSAGFNWLDGTTVDATTLLREQIIPLAEAGLRSQRVDEGDIERYLGVVRDRVERKVTGSSWAIRSLAAMEGHGKVAERMTAVTAATLARQDRGIPIHEWELAHLEEGGGWTPTFKTVEQYMTTTLFTVHEDELIDLVAFLMDKNTIRHVLVENADHELVGIVSYRSLLRMIAKGQNPNADPLPVSQVMHADPITATPDTTTLDAIDLMRANQVSCLPVVSQGKLVGIVSESDFMPIAYHLLTRTTGFER